MVPDKALKHLRKRKTGSVKVGRRQGWSVYKSNCGALKTRQTRLNKTADFIDMYTDISWTCRFVEGNNYLPPFTHVASQNPQTSLKKETSTSAYFQRHLGNQEIYPISKSHCVPLSLLLSGPTLRCVCVLPKTPCSVIYFHRRQKQPDKMAAKTESLPIGFAEGYRVWGRWWLLTREM